MSLSRLVPGRALLREPGFWLNRRRARESKCQTIEAIGLAIDSAVIRCGRLVLSTVVTVPIWGLIADEVGRGSSNRQTSAPDHLLSGLQGRGSKRAEIRSKAALDGSDFLHGTMRTVWCDR